MILERVEIVGFRGINRFVVDARTKQRPDWGERVG